MGQGRHTRRLGSIRARELELCDPRSPALGDADQCRWGLHTPAIPTGTHMYVRLTDPFGNDVWVNSLLVQRVRTALPSERMDDSIQTTIIMSSSNQMVQETPAAVMRLLEAADNASASARRR